MMGKSHLAIGMAVSVNLLLAAGKNPAVQPSLFLVGVSVGALAALLPDIDGDPNSPADPMIRSVLGVGQNQTKRKLWRTLFKGDVVGFLIAVGQRIIAVILNILAAALPHRGVTHWIWVAIGLSFICWAGCLVLGVPSLVALCFFAGYTSHLLADMMTKSGVPILGFLGPKNKQGKYQSYHLLPKHLRLRTGTFMEVMVVALLLSVFVFIGTSFFVLYSM